MSHIKSLVKYCAKSSAPFSSFHKKCIKPKTFEETFGKSTFQNSHADLHVIFFKSTNKKNIILPENTLSDKADG